MGNRGLAGLLLASAVTACGGVTIDAASSSSTGAGAATSASASATTGSDGFQWIPCVKPPNEGMQPAN